MNLLSEKEQRLALVGALDHFGEAQEGIDVLIAVAVQWQTAALAYRSPDSHFQTDTIVKIIG